MSPPIGHEPAWVGHCTFEFFMQMIHRFLHLSMCGHLVGEAPCEQSQCPKVDKAHKYPGTYALYTLPFPSASSFLNEATAYGYAVPNKNGQSCQGHARQAPF